METIHWFLYTSSNGVNAHKINMDLFTAVRTSTDTDFFPDVFELHKTFGGFIAYLYSVIW
jgi:hypothetical protein